MHPLFLIKVGNFAGGPSSLRFIKHNKAFIGQLGVLLNRVLPDKTVHILNKGAILQCILQHGDQRTITGQKTSWIQVLPVVRQPCVELLVVGSL